MRNTIHQALRGTKLDELVLGVMSAGLAPDVAGDAGDTLVDIELVDVNYIDDWAATNQFVRFSAPYERIEIEPLREGYRRPRPTTFVRTIPVRTAVSELVTRRYDKTEPSELGTELVVEPMPEWRADSWRWLAISLAVAAIAVVVIMW